MLGPKSQVVLQIRLWQKVFGIMKSTPLGSSLFKQAKGNPMEKICWEQFKHRYGPDGQLKAWADYQRAYQQWRRSCLTDMASSGPNHR